MKKLIFLPLIFALLLSVASAINISVQEVPMTDVIIKEVEESAIFDLTIENLGPADSFQIYSFVGVDIKPSEKFRIGAGESQTIRIQATPSESIRKNYRDWFLFEYRIAGMDPGTYKDKLKIKLIPLEEALDIGEVIVFPDKDEAVITVINNEDKQMDNLILRFDSDFFEYSEAFSLSPFQSRNITVQISKNIQSLSAGEYELNTEVEYKGASAEVESRINYLEHGGILTTRDSEGFIVVKTELTKENVGNVPSVAEIKESKNIVSRLFTTFTTIPTSVERKGFFVEYSWQEELQPGESLAVTMRTNYTFPFILLILIIIAIAWVRIKTQTDLVLKKRVQFVRTKGGEFALRIRLKAKARKNLQDVKIIDHIPGTTKLHAKTMFPPATSVDEKTRRIHWNLPSMRKGEERTFSYVIYSNISIVGSFELPLAHASYKSEDKQKFVSSNQTSFAAEGN
ncbi:hypothetical protein GW924_03580 [Candidatus Pacearchaeota archaeon]|nr:hypothetical protein [Candidatus Pacearchaeota archaeon]